MNTGFSLSCGRFPEGILPGDLDANQAENKHPEEPGVCSCSAVVKIPESME